MSYDEKMYGIVIVGPDGAKRLFGRVRRSRRGEVFAVWAEDESPENLGRGSNPHASYHSSGRLHSKTHDRATVIKQLQAPDHSFLGNQPIEATNADRGLSPTLPPLSGRFDDLFEIPSNLLTGGQEQAITVDVVEPSQTPIRLTGSDTVLAEKIFEDAVPWIIVSLVEASTLFPSVRQDRGTIEAREQ
jgi:hypothetical protein